jgi:hypothetical protein
MYVETNEYNIGGTKDIRMRKGRFFHHEETNRINSWLKVGCRYDGWTVGRMDRCMYGYPPRGHNCFLLQRCRNQVNELET